MLWNAPIALDYPCRASCYPYLSTSYHASSVFFIPPQASYLHIKFVIARAEFDTITDTVCSHGRSLIPLMRNQTNFTEGDNEAGLRLTGRDIDMVQATEGNNGRAHYGQLLLLGEPTTCVTKVSRQVLDWSLWNSGEGSVPCNPKRSYCRSVPD